MQQSQKGAVTARISGTDTDKINKNLEGNQNKKLYSSVGGSLKRTTVITEGKDKILLKQRH